jgi:hypothetical protein
VKTTPKVDRKQGQKRGRKGLKNDRKGAKKVDFRSFLRVFRRDFLAKYADDKRVKLNLHQIHGSFFCFFAREGILGPIFWAENRRGNVRLARIQSGDR